MKLRLCSVSLGEDLYSKEDGGEFSPMMERIAGVVSMMFTNYTITMNGYGDVVDASGRYNGCFGDLQQNKTDIASQPVNLPVNAVNVTNSECLLSSTTTIFSSYNSTYEDEKTDVMEFFEAFDFCLWMIVLTAIVVLVCIQVTAIKIRGKRRSAVQWVENLLTSTLLKQFGGINITSIRFSVRFSLLLISIFIFELHFFLTSMIKTDMVVQKAPDTISTYEEMVEHPRSSPAFLEAASTHWEFKDAPKDSLQGKLWKRAEKAKGTFLEFSMDGFSSLFTGISNKEKVLMVPSFYVRSFRTNFCSSSRGTNSFLDANVWHRTDPEAREYLMGFARSTKTPEKVAKRIDQMSRRLMEHEIFPQVVAMTDYLMFKNGGKPEVQDCMANVILYPDHDLVSVNLSHYSGLWKFLFVGWFLVIFSFVLEVTVHHIVSAFMSYVQSMSQSLRLV